MNTTVKDSSGNKRLSGGNSTPQTIIEQLDADCAKIAKLDPLEVDPIMKVLPTMNERKYINGLEGTLFKILPDPAKLFGFKYHEAAAAMRDLGFFIGSIKRLGTEPLKLVPSLDFVLDVLGEKTNMPPRDTLLHYTVWNPKGRRMRTYTGTPDEKALIESVRISMNPLVNAIYGLLKLHSADFDGPGFALYAELILLDFKSVVNGIVHAKRNVSPEVFANHLRQYFDSIHLWGKEYLGPGAVEMPFFVFDHLLWSSDCYDAEYKTFKETYLPYIIPKLRKVYDEADNKPSLLTKFEQDLEGSGKLNFAKIEAADRIISLCKMIKGFRMPHKKLAEESYGYEDPEHRDKGSGGYSPAILSKILSLFLERVERFENTLIAYKNRVS